MRILVGVQAFLLATGALVQGTEILVDPMGGGEFTAIQPALDAAPDGATVLVAPGEYLVTEPIDFNRLHDAGPAKTLTLRSVAGRDATVIRRAESPDGEAAGVVVFRRGETRECVLEGFTISGGSSSLWPHRETGGGILCIEGSSPTVRDCLITENSCLSVGCGGIYCGPATAPEFVDCDIVFNGGVGVYCYEAAATLIACRISYNRGMGVYDYDSSSVLHDCEIRGNGGTGVDVSTESTTTIERCVVIANGGNGVFCGSSAAPEVTDCILSANRLAGISCEYDAAPRVSSSTISHNRLSGVSSGDPASVQLIRCTIAANLDHGVSLVPGMPSVVRSCIVWGNLGGSIRDNDGEAPDVRYSCVAGDAPLPGPGNIGSDPGFCGHRGPTEVFVDASAEGPGDGSVGSPYPSLESALAYSFSLVANSPCLGTGADGGDMGDDLPVCEAAGVETREVFLAAGTYGMSGLSLIHHASLHGAGRASTVIEGSVLGLRTGAVLEDLMITRGEVGISIQHGQRPAIRRVTVRGNRYGGINCLQSSPTIDDCVIANNYLRGLYCRNASPVLTNCAVWGNWANIDGGGVYLSGASEPTLRFCTITGNLATRWGNAGVVCSRDAHPILESCIVWGNTPQVVCGVLRRTITMENPRFVSRGVIDFERTTTAIVGGLTMEFPDYVVEEPDLRLLPGSPAIDAGSCDNAPDHDLDGRPRPGGAGCDVGAYEAPGADGDDGNEGFESGDLAPWVLTGSGAVVGEDFFVPGILPSSGDRMGYISTLNNEFLVHMPEATIPRVDLDDDGEVEREFSALTRTVSATQPSIISFDLNFLTDELLPDGAVNDSDLFGVTMGSVIDGPYELLFAVAPADGSYSGSAEEVTRADFSDEFIEEIPTFGVFPTIVDSSRYQGQTGFRRYSIRVAAGDHTVTFFVADSHTDGVASGLLIDRFSVAAVSESEGGFRRGDANGDANVDVSDAVFVLAYLFHGTSEVECLDSADADDTGALDLTDAVYVLNYLYLGGPAPAQPVAGCGPDPTSDALGCVSFPPCLER